MTGKAVPEGMCCGSFRDLGFFDCTPDRFLYMRCMQMMALVFTKIIKKVLDRVFV
jgi:hypothetical protein